MMKIFLYVFLSLICFGLSFYITPFIIKFINFIALALFDKLVFNAFLMFVFAILCYFIYSKSFFGFVLFVLNVGRDAMPKRK